MENMELELLKKKCSRIRALIIDEIATLGVGHVGGSLSAVEALVLLYNKVMNIDPKNPNMDGRDRFIMSKGHAGPAVYAVLADRGYFPIDMLHTLNKPETNLPSHCDMHRTPGVDMTTGSLGQGMSCAVGISKASKIKKDNAYIYCMLGDGESQEGQIWEAAMAAAHFKLNNLIVFTDDNKIQLDGNVKDIMTVEPLDKKWEAFGWNVIVVDGHDILKIYDAIVEAKQSQCKPTMIILNTIKGKGVSFIEDMGFNNHSMNLNEEQKIKALKELGEEV